MLKKNLEYILEELYKIYNIPIIIVDKEKKIIFPKKLSYSDNDLNLGLLKYKHPENIIIFEDNEYFSSLFKITNTYYKNYYILIGPYFLINMQNILSEKFKNITNLYSITNKRQEFINFTKLIFTILNNRIIDESELIFLNYFHEKKTLNNIFQINLELRKDSDIELDSVELERRLINSIIQNDLKSFNWIFNQMHKTYFARINSDRLTSLKYKYVGLVSILTRVSINNSVGKAEAYALSDSLIQQLEYIKSLQECIVYIKESCLLFMQLINSDFYSVESPLVKTIYSYIDTHIYEKITLEKISHHCQKSKNYLSSEFKKYTGLTIHNYINKRKIKEAIHILLFTNLSFSEIASKLSFSDQSHFIQKFKQIEGMTPKEYRQKYQSTKLL